MFYLDENSLQTGMPEVYKPLTSLSFFPWGASPDSCLQMLLVCSPQASIWNWLFGKGIINLAWLYLILMEMFLHSENQRLATNVRSCLKDLQMQSSLLRPDFGENDANQTSYWLLWWKKMYSICFLVRSGERKRWGAEMLAWLSGWWGVEQVCCGWAVHWGWLLVVVVNPQGLDPHLLLWFLHLARRYQCVCCRLPLLLFSTPFDCASIQPLSSSTPLNLYSHSPSLFLDVRREQLCLPESLLFLFHVIAFIFLSCPWVMSVLDHMRSVLRSMVAEDTSFQVPD